MTKKIGCICREGGREGGREAERKCRIDSIYKILSCGQPYINPTIIILILESLWLEICLECNSVNVIYNRRWFKRLAKEFFVLNLFRLIVGKLMEFPTMERQILGNIASSIYVVQLLWRQMRDFHQVWQARCKMCATPSQKLFWNIKIIKFLFSERGSSLPE